MAWVGSLENQKKGIETIKKLGEDPVWANNVYIKRKNSVLKARSSLNVLLSDPVWRDNNNKKMYEKRYISNNSIKLTEKQEQLIYGTALGDASFIFQSTNKTPRLYLEHCKDSADYIIWKYNKISNLCASAPKERSRFRFGKIHNSIYFNTRHLPCLLEPYNNMIKNGKKVITDDLITVINNLPNPEFAIALVYMDDGCLAHRCDGSSNTISISMGDREQNECEIFCEWLLKSFGVTSHIYSRKDRVCKNGEYYKDLMIVGQKNMLKFRDIISPYVSEVPSMYRKIKLIFNGNLV